MCSGSKVYHVHTLILHRSLFSVNVSSVTNLCNKCFPRLKALMLPKSTFDNNSQEREFKILVRLKVSDSAINWTELFLYRKNLLMTISDLITLCFLHWRYTALDAASISTIRSLYSLYNHVWSYARCLHWLKHGWILRKAYCFYGQYIKAQNFKRLLITVNTLGYTITRR